MPTISQLTYIVAVDRLGHFGKAARECRIAQPSLSMQIQKVEEEIGFLIFDRNRKPVVATEKGELFLKQARVVLNEHQKLVMLSKENFSELSGRFHLGIIPTIMPYLLHLFLKKFSESYPKVKLVVDELKTQDIIKCLHEDRLDAGILATPLGEKGIKERPLYYENFHLYIDPDHPLAKKEVIVAEDLGEQDIWLLEDGHCFRNQILNFCTTPRENSVFPNVTFEGGNLETLRMLVRNGRGYTLVPYLFTENLDEEERSSYIRNFKEPIPTREVSLVYSRDQWKKDILDALFWTIQSQLPELISRKSQATHQVLPIK